MKILIYDNNQEDMQKLCDMLSLLPEQFMVDKVTHYTDGVEFYNKYHYDMVFIDFNDDIGKKLLASILEINPKQKIITMGDTTECSDAFGCDNCKGNYNKLRVLRPISEKELLKIIFNKEECMLYCNDPLMMQLSLISKKLNSVVFDKDKFVFKKIGTNHHKNTQEIIQLTYELSERNIKFELNDAEITIFR